MNGPLSMYRMKPVVRHDFKVQLPDCMYKMKNIHASRNGMVEQRSQDHISSPMKKLDIHDQNNQNLVEMAALEARQEQILQQLSDLKKQIASIRNNLNINQTTNETVPRTIIKTSHGKAQKLPDIVINASPTHPPYSLELIQKLWKNYMNFSVKTHVHSSLSNLSEEAIELTKILESFAPENGVPQVSVRLIWKKGGADPELIISHTSIKGEVNILRYLSRVSNDDLNYENYPNVHEIDCLLDTCYCLIKSKTKTGRTKFLRNLQKSLEKGDWLAGRSQISIADLAAYSAIKQVTSSSEINVGLGKWLQRCVTY